MDIKTEFTDFCGPSVLYKSHVKEGRTLRIFYSIPAVDQDQDRRVVVSHLRNGLETILRRTVRAMADSARNHAYHRTGHRDADMQRLLSGRVI